jgi:transposase
MQLEMLDVTIRDYINDYVNKMQTGYEQRIKELENNYEASLKQAQLEYEILKERYDLLVYKRFARSAEQLLADKKQPPLFAEEDRETFKPEETEEKEITEVKSFKRNKAGRKPIDPNIPREEKIVDIAESEKTCACGAHLTKIGEETSEKLHIVPPRIYVEKTIRPKYACRCCEGSEDEDNPAVRIAPLEPSIIPRSIASPSLLTCIMIQKYEDHLPFYRQEKQFERIGVRISRQDMSNWQQMAYNKLEPLFGLLKETVKSGPVIQMDETPVQVMGEEGRSDTQKSYMWLARGGPPLTPVVLYEYRKTRGAYNAKEFLSGYCGYLQTDGYPGYDAAVEGNSKIIHVGCFAHARRRFHEASKVTEKPQSAEEGIKHIRKLYHLEEELRSQNLDEETFLTERKARAGPILEDFKKWLKKREDGLLSSSLLGKAILYSLAQWDKMTAYLGSLYLTPDNNACENAIRPFVLGRKNWLFNKSPEGAKSSCGMYSLIETAKQNRLVPLKYLTALFEKAPLAVSPDDWKKLLPWNIFTA